MFDWFYLKNPRKYKLLKKTKKEDSVYVCIGGCVLYVHLSIFNLRKEASSKN
jgi:hypothetical protein